MLKHSVAFFTYRRCEFEYIIDARVWYFRTDKQTAPVLVQIEKTRIRFVMIHSSNQRIPRIYAKYAKIYPVR